LSLPVAAGRLVAAVVREAIELQGEQVAAGHLLNQRLLLLYLQTTRSR